MAGVFKTWLSNMAKIIKVKTGMLPSEKIKPLRFPDLIASISGGAGNAVVNMGRVTISSLDIVDGVATIKHDLGVKPDYILVFALDSPEITSEYPFCFMGFAGGSKAMSDKIVERFPNIESTGFLYSRSYSQGDADNDYAYINTALKEYNYEDWLGMGNAGLLGSIYSVTTTTMAFGSQAQPMKAGRELFFAVIGNLF